MDTFRAEVKALLAADTNENTEDTAEPVVTYPEKLTSGYYRVRKTWKDSKSQVGAYRVLANAKAAADKNPGTHVFTNDGVAIYPVDDATDSGTADYRIHTVVKGDTLWDIAALYLGKGSRYPEIKTLNGLKSNVIYSGWKLKDPQLTTKPIEEIISLRWAYFYAVFLFKRHVHLQWVVRKPLGLEEPTMTDLQKEQIKTLRLQGISYVKIGEMLGISDNTVRSFCRRNGLGDAAKNTVACKHCGKLIKIIPKQKPRKFCSDACRTAWWNSHPDCVDRKAVYALHLRPLW